MISLKSVKLVNIQSHANTLLEFPQTGIIRFYGDNSNGKSVMVKALWDTVSNDITKPKMRHSLIRRGNSFGEVTYVRWDNVELFVHIHLEAAQTYAELRKPGQDPVRRYLADKTIPLLVQEFGFHYTDKHGLSVNVHKDDDALLFTSTRHSVNYDIWDSAASDKYAEHTLEELERIQAETKKTKKVFEQARTVDVAALNAIVMYDVAKEEARREKLAYLAYNLSRCVTMPLPKIKPVPKVVTINKIGPMPKLRYPKIYQKMATSLPDIVSIAKELEALRNNVCPTCGRNFKEGVNCHE